MDIGARLRQLRELRKMSQGDVEVKTKLLRCYSSRVENGHTVPSIETLAKYANAFGVELYQLFIEDGAKPQSIIPAEKKNPLTRKQLITLQQIAKLIPRLDDRNTKLLLSTAKQMATR